MQVDWQPCPVYTNDTENPRMFMGRRVWPRDNPPRPPVNYTADCASVKLPLFYNASHR